MTKDLAYAELTTVVARLYLTDMLDNRGQLWKGKLEKNWQNILNLKDQLGVLSSL